MQCNQLALQMKYTQLHASQTSLQLDKCYFQVFSVTKVAYICKVVWIIGEIFRFCVKIRSTCLYLYLTKDGV